MYGRFTTETLRPLPYIKKRQLCFGVQPLKRGFPKLANAVFAGLDTETDIIEKATYEELYKPFGIRPQFLQTIQTAYSGFDGEDIKVNYYEEKNQSLDNLKYIPHLNDKKYSLYVFCHNLAFDMNALFGEDLEKLSQGHIINDWSGKIVFNVNAFAILKNIKTKRSIRFIDTFNFFKGKLGVIAHDNLHEEKLERPSWLGKKTPQEMTPEEKIQFYNYAVRDAELVLKLGLEAIKKPMAYDLPVSVTYPNMASKIIRKYYLKKPMTYPTLKTLRFIWNTYHGARVESMIRGTLDKTNIKIYDVNSLYPYAMSQPQPMSCDYKKNMFWITSLEEVLKNKDKIAGWYFVKFKFPESCRYPCLPVRDKKLFFPLESFSYCTHEELMLALDLGVEIDFIKGYVYFFEESDYNTGLKMFVDQFYTQKMALDKLKKERELTHAEKKERDTIKLLLNSSYGKFAEKREENGYLKAGNFFNPLIASRITGIARASISRLMIKANSLYSDTDCIHTQKEMPTSLKLGDLKLEQTLDKGMYVRSKIYLGFKKDECVAFAHHGLQKKEDEDDDNKPETNEGELELIKMFLQDKGEKISYVRHRMIKMKEAMARGLVPMLNEQQLRTLAVSEDGKRIYEKKIKTLEELRTEFCMSRPVECSYRF